MQAYPCCLSTRDSDLDPGIPPSWAVTRALGSPLEKALCQWVISAEGTRPADREAERQRNFAF